MLNHFNISKEHKVLFDIVNRELGMYHTLDIPLNEFNIKL